MLQRCVFKSTNASTVPSFGAAALKDLSSNVDRDLPLGGTKIKLSFERKLYLVAFLIVIRLLMYCGARP